MIGEDIDSASSDEAKDPKKVLSTFGIIAMVMMLVILFAIAVKAKVVPNLKEVEFSPSF